MRQNTGIEQLRELVSLFSANIARLTAGGQKVELGAAAPIIANDISE